MAGIQSAVNAMVSAPGSIKITQNISDVLKKELADEKATTTAYGKMTNIFSRLANNEDVSKEEIKEVGELIKQVPAQNREMFGQSLKSVQSLARSNISQQMRVSMLQDRLAEYMNRPNVPKAVAMTSSYDLNAKEEMKSGTTKTSR